ncbi:hypothetical protein GH810_07305 [Acetobacterium paludosum]|uniref:AttH domain-containing protein n=1 Tax=Acetobacterium paludosum TaxID=52693 RepID=A0A923HT16_9FIRM|nr:hypothetical protein [Acetobacterium paludosum]MBC3888113.1 hypothetical protein [Acetobacterium paludosum]
MYPKSGNPEVTMFEESMLYPEEGTTDHGFMDWGWMCHVKDEEGTDYYMDFGLAKMKMNATWGAMPFGTEDMDSWNLSCRTSKGDVSTPKGQIFKVANFEGVTDAVWRPFPGGSMQFEKDEKNNTFKIVLDKFTCEIDVNKKTWHATVYDEQLDVGVDFTHYGEGHPFWYSKDEVRTLVDHLKVIGYNWPGRVEGVLTIKGVKHNVTGFGARERAVLPDQSNVEAGGWLDLIMYHFDEMHGVIQEYKMSKDKTASLYIRESDEYFATKDARVAVDEMVNFNIVHEDWAYLKAIGCFVPTTFYCTLETPAGKLDFMAKACGSKCVALQAGVEVDVPNLTLDADIVEGTFTYKDGRVIELHNGHFINNLVLWRTFPSYFPNFIGANDFVEVNAMKE